MNLPFSGQPYAFISYSHKDEKEVSKIIKRMSRLGYRIWFDRDKLSHSKDFNEEIAYAITNCRVFIVFLSKNSCKSEYVKNEINLASNSGITIIPCILDDCTLPGGVQLQVGRTNFLRRSGFYNDESYIEAICREAVSCRGEKENQVVCAGEHVGRSAGSAKKHVVLAAAGVLIAAAVWLIVFTLSGGCITGNGWFRYSVDDHGNVTITDYIGIGGNVVVPDEIFVPSLEYFIFLDVTKIGPNAFAGSSIDSVIIPNSVEEIGDRAFYDCHGLFTVKIPPSVKYIGVDAFTDCGKRITSYSSRITVTAPHDMEYYSYLYHDNSDFTLDWVVVN